MRAFTRWLCDRGKHDYSRWYIYDSTVGYGLKPMVIKVQSRECIRPHCGFTQVEPVMVRMNHTNH